MEFQRLGALPLNARALGAVSKHLHYWLEVI